MIVTRDILAHCRADSLYSFQHANGDSPNQSMSTEPMTTDILKAMFLHNSKACNQVVAAGRGNWGGRLARWLVLTVALIAFTCILRLDEVLNLRYEDIEVLERDRIKITLRSRKTNQTGGTAASIRSRQIC